MWNYQSPIGTREAVLAHLQENLKVDGKRFPSEVHQVESVKAYLTAEINNISAELNGVRVVASGSIRPENNSRIVTINIQPQKVLV